MMFEQWEKLSAEMQLGVLVSGTAVLGVILLWWRQRLVAACLAAAEKRNP